MTACPKGYFGYDCLHRCNTYCSGNESCNRFTGVCDEGCMAGRTDPKCGMDINSGMSGILGLKMFDVPNLY